MGSFLRFAVWAAVEQRNDRREFPELACPVREHEVVEAAREAIDSARSLRGLDDVPIGKHSVRTDEKSGSQRIAFKFQATHAAFDGRQPFNPDVHVDLLEMRPNVSFETRCTRL